MKKMVLMMFLCSIAAAQSSKDPYLVEIKPEGDRVGVVLSDKTYLVKCSGNRVQLQARGTPKNMVAPFIVYDITSKTFTLDRKRPAEAAGKLLISCERQDVHFTAGANVRLFHQAELHPEVIQSH